MLAAAAALALPLLHAATRPRYGGILRVEIRQSYETADPPQTGTGIPDLGAAFSITQWEAGRRAVFTANDTAPGGRPFLDGITVEMNRPPREQFIDLELGRSDIVELDPADPRRPTPPRKSWTTSAVRLVALVFGPRVEDARVREALSLAVDRTAISNVLLQKQAEVSAALLPQWLSGHAFLFSPAQDLARARALVGGVPAAARTLTLAVADPSNRRIADRIALNAHDAGLTLAPATPGSSADVRLVEVRIAFDDPARALAALAAALRLSDGVLRGDSAETLYATERTLLDGFRAVPLFHLPDSYGVGQRVRGGAGVTPLGEWRFERLWLEPARP